MQKEKINEAIILSGGKGKRLWPLTEEIPKALIKINNKPLIEYQIEWLEKHGVDSITLTLNKKFFELSKKELGNKVKYVLEEEILGTAGGIKNVLSKKLVEGEEFFVINVDDLTDIDLNELMKKGSNTICIAQMTSPYGIVHTNGEYVKKFEEKPKLDLWVNCGVYLLNKNIYEKLPDIGDFEKDVFPFLKLKHHKHFGKWNTVNTQKDVEKLEKIKKQMKMLITGGAGFIGSNIAEHFLSNTKNKVIIFDNLSRPGGGAKKNIEYLLEKYKNNANFQFVKGDIRNYEELSAVMKDTDIIFHVAAQTAMTISIENPIEDFDTNAKGTFNVLEAVRKSNCNPIIIYTSTNKVYGDLTRKQVKLVEKEKRWDFIEEYAQGINEAYPLDFEGPYGCSKGTGDAYCLDYARTFGMKIIVFRMSGIYGSSQYPTEDQGWVGWFLRRAMKKEPVTIYGDGKQVRDILFISDLISAFNKAIENIDKTKGQVYNIGGGRENSISILELLEFLEKNLYIKPLHTNLDKWRLADQKVYISNISKAKRDFEWEPKVKKEEGIKKLYEWMKSIKEK